MKINLILERKTRMLLKLMKCKRIKIYYMHNVYNTENETELDLFLTENMQGVQLDTCLQPADIGQLVLDICFNQVF